MRKETKDGSPTYDHQAPEGLAFGFSPSRPNMEVFSWEGISGFVNRATATHFKVRAFEAPEGRYLFGGDEFDLFQPEPNEKGEKIPIHLPNTTEGLYKVELFKQVNTTGSPKLMRVPIRPVMGGPEYDLVVNFTGSSLISQRESAQRSQAAANGQALVAASRSSALMQQQAAQQSVPSAEALTHAGLSQVLGVVLKALDSSYEVQGKQARAMTDYVDRIEARLSQSEDLLKKKEKKLRKLKAKERSALDKIAAAVESDPSVLKDALAGLFGLAAQWSPMAQAFRPSSEENTEPASSYPSDKGRRKK